MDHNDDIAAIVAALGCSAASAQALMSGGRLRLASAGAALIHQGDSAQSHWLILDGAVRCEVTASDGRTTVLTSHPPGDLIGSFGRRDAAMPGSLIASASARLLTIPVGLIEKIAANDPLFALAIAYCCARQAERLQHSLAARVSLTAPGRIYAQLLDTAGPALIIDPAPVIAALAISVQTSRETASRAISTLERRGIIRRDGGKLIIASRRLLEDLVV